MDVVAACYWTAVRVVTAVVLLLLCAVVVTVANGSVTLALPHYVEVIAERFVRRGEACQKRGRQTLRR